MLLVYFKLARDLCTQKGQGYRKVDGSESIVFGSRTHYGKSPDSMAQAIKLVVFTQWPESETAGPTSQSAGFERQIMINFAVIIDGNQTHKAPVSRDIVPTTNPGW